jgi:hypothetical protein
MDVYNTTTLQQHRTEWQCTVVELSSEQNAVMPVRLSCLLFIALIDTCRVSPDEFLKVSEL